jgi:actin cytoskeleton-regulatory complex protein SLA1
MVFIGLYRAAYDYEPQADNELAIKENDLLCILDKGDDDWWKAKKKALSEDDDEPEGLIPGNYVEQAKPISKGKGIYEYTRQTDEEISFPDEAELDVYDTSDQDWTLVGFNGEYGYAPAIYIELEEAPPPMPSRPQISHRPPSPDSEEEPALPPRRPTAEAISPEAAEPSLAEKLAGIIQPKASSLKASSSRAAQSSPPVVALPPRKQVQFTPEESDEEVPAPRLPRRPPTEQYPSSNSSSSSRPTKHVSIREPEPEPEQEEPGSAGIVASMPHNRVVSAVYDEESSHHSPGGFHLYNIYEIVEVMGKNRKAPITLGINLAKGVISISSETSRDKEWTADKLTHYSMEGKHVFMELVRPSKSIDFHAGAKDTAAEIMSALGELAGAARAEGLKEVFRASGASQKVGKIMYDFAPVDDNDVQVSAGDEVIVLDDSKDEWWLVRRKENGVEGTVPSNYVEIIGTVTNATSSSRGTSSKKTFVQQNRLEEERLTREASNPTRKESRAGEVGPGLQLPERGSSLSQDSDRRRSSQKAQQDNKAKRSQASKSSRSFGNILENISNKISAKYKEDPSMDRSIGIV